MTKNPKKKKWIKKNFESYLKADLLLGGIVLYTELATLTGMEASDRTVWEEESGTGHRTFRNGVAIGSEFLGCCGGVQFSGPHSRAKGSGYIHLYLLLNFKNKKKKEEDSLVLSTVPPSRAIIDYSILLLRMCRLDSGRWSQNKLVGVVVRKIKQSYFSGAKKRLRGKQRVFFFNLELPKV